MTRQLLGIFADDQGWHLGYAQGEALLCIGLPLTRSDASPDLANAVLRAMNDLGLTATQVVLGLPASQCLAARICTEGLPKKNRRPALSYRLEEQLPVDTEGIITDFVESSAGTLGVAVSIDCIKPAVDALEDCGIHIAAICPIAALVLQSRCDSMPERGAGLLLLQSGISAQIDVLTVKDRSWTAWHHVPYPAGVDRCLKRIAVDEPLVAAVHGIGLALEPMACVAERWVDATVVTDDRDSLQLAMTTAKAIINGEQPPLVTFRRDQMASRDRLYAMRKPFKSLTAAVAVLFVCIIAVSLYRGIRYQSLAGLYDQQQVTLFQDLFPRQAIPEQGGIAARVRSEARKLEGISGQATQLPARTSMVKLFHQTLTGLPRNLRFRLLELRLDSHRIYLDGQTRSHSDAEAIAAGLRRSLAMQIEPPRTENLPDKGVAFTITGSTDHRFQPGGGAP